MQHFLSALRRSCGIMTPADSSLETMDVLPSVLSGADSLLHRTSYSYLEVLKLLANNTSDTWAEAQKKPLCAVEEMNEYSGPSCTGIVGNVRP